MVIGTRGGRYQPQLLSHFILKILKNFRICKEDILDFNPDKIILIDYPGFNLRISKWAKKKGL